ncbi:MAG: hypothetical protein C0485_01845 [Pirellula sp.]|nr:hypothetical protein [Pirellula sp.]
MLAPDRPTIETYLQLMRHPVAVIARKPHDLRAPNMQVLWPIDLTEPIEQVLWLAEQYNAVYVNLNPLKPQYEIVRPRPGSSIRDAMIQRRTRVLIDVDGHDVPKEEAERQKNEIKKYLGWPVLMENDTGNGYGLIYECDYPTDRESNDLVKRFLHGLKEQFSCVDVSCSNAGRLTRLIGTLNVRHGERIATRILNGSSITQQDTNEAEGSEAA